jgi:serine/threonine-protein kinase
VVFAAVVSSAKIVGAQGEVVDSTKLQEAKTLYDRANARLEANDLTTALDLFRQSRGVVPSVYNVQGEAYCLYQLGRYDEAFERYQQLERSYRTELGEEAGRALDRRLDELRQRTGVLAVAGPVGAMIWVDGRERGTVAQGEPIVVLPGRRSIRVTHAERTILERIVSVRAGATSVVQVPSPRASTAMPPLRQNSPVARKPVVRIERPWTLRRVAGWSAVGTGIAGVGIGSYFGYRAISKKRESDAALDHGDCFADCYEAWEDGRRAARVSNVAFGVGALALIGGSYLLLSDNDAVSASSGGAYSLGWSRKW